MCKNRIERKTDLRSFHLGQDILIPYSKIYAQHTCAEINVLNVGLRKKKQKTHTHTTIDTPPHSSNTATEILN